MELYLYFACEEAVNLDDLEEGIDALLGGTGEVTGRGMGISGCNIDIEVYDEEMPVHFLEGLRRLKLPKHTYYVIDGVKKALFVDHKLD